MRQEALPESPQFKFQFAHRLRQLAPAHLWLRAWTWRREQPLVSTAAAPHIIISWYRRSGITPDCFAAKILALNRLPSRWRRVCLLGRLNAVIPDDNLVDFSFMQLPDGTYSVRCDRCGNAVEEKLKSFKSVAPGEACYGATKACAILTAIRISNI